METDFKALLEQAFTQARQSGKRDWHRMTTAVLKNRLLQLTDRGFQAEQYGAPNLLALLARFTECVRVERTSPLPTVEWLQAEVNDQIGDQVIVGKRVREDLWRAVLDYSSGQQYEWDATARQARAVESANPAVRLPTVSPGDLRAWREEFANSHRGGLDGERDLSLLDAWLEHGLGTMQLPRALRPTWNEFLKVKVAQVVASWFRDRGMDTPSVMVPLRDPRAAEVDDLRTYLHHCIDAMSEQELREIRLPASVAHRVSLSR